jgi:hypothetical protein
VALAIVLTLTSMCWQRYQKYRTLSATSADFERYVELFRTLPVDSHTLRRFVLYKVKGPFYVSSTILPKAVSGTSLRIAQGDVLTIIYRVRPRKRGQPRISLRVILQNEHAGVEYRYLKVNSFESKCVVQHE